jgi:hypothetical protein
VCKAPSWVLEAWEAAEACATWDGEHKRTADAAAVLSIAWLRGYSGRHAREVLEAGPLTMHPGEDLGTAYRLSWDEDLPPARPCLVWEETGRTCRAWEKLQVSE